MVAKWTLKIVHFKRRIPKVKKSNIVIKTKSFISPMNGRNLYPGIKKFVAVQQVSFASLSNGIKISEKFWEIHAELLASTVDVIPLETLIMWA